MKDYRKLILATTLLVTALIVGCECFQQPPEPVEAAAPQPVMTGCPPSGSAGSGMALPTGDKRTSVVWVEKSGPQQVMAGKEFGYQIKVTNLTKMELAGVQVTETLPDGFKLSDASPAGTSQAGKVSWMLASLPAGESRTMTLRGMAEKTGPLRSCTEVQVNPPVLCLNMQAVQPELQLAMSAASEAILCDAIEYKIVVTNTGTGTACNVKIMDELPDGMRSLDGQTALAGEVGNLEPGQSGEMTFQVRVTKPGAYVNVASVTADGLPQPQRSETTTTVRTPVLVVTKTAPEVRFVGRPITYTISVANSGDAPAKDTVLVEEISRLAEFVSASHGGVHSDHQVTWDLGTLAPGASKDVSLVVKPLGKGEVASIASATAYCASGQGKAGTMVKGIPAILLECVDLDDPIEVGANTTYVVTVTNQGSEDGTNIVINCVLPTELTFVSAEGPTEESVAGGEIGFAPLDRLAPQERAVYKIVARGKATGDVRFNVRLTSDQMTSPAAESESTNVYE